MSSVGSADTLTTVQWRELTRGMTADYLARDFDRDTDGGARARLTSNQYWANPEAAHKADRHAAASAFSRRVTDELVLGEGAEARFAARYLKIGPVVGSGLSHLGVLRMSVVGMYTAAATRLEGRNRRTHVRDFLDMYDISARNWPSGEAVSRDTLREGNTFPGELAGFVGLTSELLPIDPRTKDLDKEGRVAMAHKLLPLLIGRASTHALVLAELPEWDAVEVGASVDIKANGRPTIIDEAGQTLFSRAIAHATAELSEDATPILMCPAHQLRPDSLETDLTLQLHAGINYAADLGYYD